MNVMKFVAGLLPQFGKDRLEEDARICITELETTTLPAYKNALSMFSSEPRSKELQDFTKQYAGQAKNFNKSHTLIESIAARLENVLTTAKYLERCVEKEFEGKVVVAGITLAKVNVLRALELCTFVSTYSLRFLNYAYVVETSALKSKNYTGDDLSKGEIAMLERNFLGFITALNSVAKPEREIVKLLEDVPEVIVNSQSEAALATVSNAKIDPLNMFAMQGFAANPIYHIGLIVAEIQSERYKRAKDLKAVLELRMLNLQRQKDGSQPDAALDREIEVLQGRIDTLSEKIRKAEESVE